MKSPCEKQVQAYACPGTCERIVAAGTSRAAGRRLRATRASGDDPLACARTSVRLPLFLAGRFHRGRSPMDAELESSPIVATLDCDFSTAPWPWSFPGASEPLPSGSRNAPGSLSLFHDDPPCDRECKFPRPAEWLPSLLPLRAAPASSPPSPVP